MKQRSLQTLYSYWNEVRAGRLAPQRLDIEPSRIAGILSETFMLERVDEATFQFRLAGTRLCELFGTELRGKNFLEGWSREDRAAVEHVLATISKQGAGAILAVEGASDTSHRVELDVMLLPLLHAGNRITRIIGAMSATSSPYWIGTEMLRTRRLKRHQLLWPDGRPRTTAEGAVGRPAPPRREPPTIRLVSSDRRRFRVLEGGRAGSKLDKH